MPKECKCVTRWERRAGLRASRCFWWSDAGERTGDCGAEVEAKEDPTEVRCSDLDANFLFLLMSCCAVS